MEKKHVYEIGFHILPTVAEEKVGDEVQALRKVIDEGKGEIISEKYPELIDLAYAMEKHIDTKKVSFDRAYFGWIKFESVGELAETLKGVVDNQASMLRYLIVKTVKENTVMSAPVEQEEKDAIDDDQKPKKVGENQEKQATEQMSKEEIDKSIDDLVIE